MQDWIDKRYWVLGADTSLGGAIARKLSRAGVDLVLSGKDQGALEDLMVSLPGRSSYIPLDMARPDTLSAVPIELGAVDGMVYAVDERQMTGLKGPNGASASMITNNLVGLSWALDIVLPQMRAHGGHVVMIDSLAGIVGLPDQAGYAASKAGVRLMAEALRAEAKGGQIAVQLVTLVGQGRRPEVAAAAVFEHMGTSRFRRTAPALAGLAVRAAHLFPDLLTRPAIASLTKPAQD